MPSRTLQIEIFASPLKSAFTISRGSKTEAVTVRVSLSENGKTGRGESVPYARYGETPESVAAAIETIRAPLEAGLTREDLQSRLPAGAARCAVDCALWDLEAKLTGVPVWQRAGLPEPHPIETAETVSLAAPEEMADAARAISGRLLKLKLGGPEDLKCLEAVHRARPEARLILDGNEGLLPEAFPAILSAARRMGVVMVEQPFPQGGDKALMLRPGAIAICADESAHTRADIQALATRYDAINIKLDKAGGLTEALAMLKEARACGMGVMVGCMVAGSLSMAPAVLLAGLADYADLDGPLWLAGDIEPGLEISGGRILPPDRALWG